METQRISQNLSVMQKNALLQKKPKYEEITVDFAYYEVIGISDKIVEAVYANLPTLNAVA